MKEILIVGGTGVISYAIVNEALKQGFRVICINRGKSKNQILDPSVEVIFADYRDREIIESKIKNRHFDVVLDVLCYNERDIEYSVSLFGDHCDQYMFLSSAEVYNKPLYEKVIHNEDVEIINPHWSYSANKAKCELKLIELASNYKFKYTIVRPAITYGNTRIPYGFMPAYGYHGTIVQRILNNKPLILFNGGENYATITRVEDFAVGFVGLIGNSKAYNQTFHVSGDEYVTWKDVLDSLGDVLGVRPIYISIDSNFIGKEVPSLSEQIVGGRSYSQRLDNSKIKNAVPDFKTNISLREGLKMTVDYYNSHNYLNGIDYLFDADIDRIVAKYCRLKCISVAPYKLGFVDYLSNASFYDKLTYWLEYHKENFFLRNILNRKNVVGKIIGKLKK
ncbi:MAG: NAD-dependent epimerase/dehydratase family protein [Bacteroidales bacterium]|nr:NAD-dependent epimerase/dehydratase family protein [Candidatus Physcocola equi]